MSKLVIGKSTNLYNSDSGGIVLSRVDLTTESFEINAIRHRELRSPNNQSGQFGAIPYRCTSQSKEIVDEALEFLRVNYGQIIFVRDYQRERVFRGIGDLYGRAYPLNKVDDPDCYVMDLVFTLEKISETPL